MTKWSTTHILIINILKIYSKLLLLLLSEMKFPDQRMKTNQCKCSVICPSTFLQFL